MKIECRHGFFEFREERPGEISEFASLFGLSLVSQGEFFTFAHLAAAPCFSIQGGTYLGGSCSKTFAGHPSEILKANALVYDLSRGLVVNYLTVTTRSKLERAGPYFISPGLINPGTIVEDGKRVVSYSGFFSFATSRFRYSEVERV